MKPQLLAKSSLEGSVFRVTIAQLIAGSTVPHSLIKVSLLVYLLVIIQSTTSRIDMLETMNIEKHQISNVVNIIGFPIGLAYLGMQLLAFNLYKNLDPQARTPILIYAIAHMNSVITYAVYPLQIWSLVTTLSIYPSQTTYIGFGIIGIALTTVQVCLILSVFRNTVPSRDFLSCIDSSHEIPVFITSMIVMVMGLLQQYDSRSTRDITLQISICIFSFLQAVYFAFNQKYWLPEANKWFMSIYTYFLASNIWDLAHISLNSHKYYLALLFIPFPLLLRLCGNFLKLTSRSDFFDKNKSPNTRIQSIMEAQRVFHSHLIEKHTIHPGSLVYYEGIFTHHLRKQGRSNDQIKEILMDYCLVTNVVIEAINTEIDKIEFWTLSSSLWMILLVTYFLGLSTLVAKCKAQLIANRSSVFMRLKQQHLITLIENKLDAVYFERVNWADIKDASIDNIYKSFAEKNSDISAMLSVVNIAAPLQFKEMFILLSKMVGRAVDSVNVIYGYILERRERNAKLVASDIFMYNRRARNSRSKIEDMLKSHIPEYKLLPLYYFPLIYMYSVVLYHNTVRAKAIMRQYNNKISTALMIKIRKTPSSKSVISNMNSAYLRIGSNQRGVNGFIKDFTNNLKNLLGEPESGTFEGKHIHDFFLRQIVPTHEVQMKISHKVVNVLGIEIPYFVMRFDGFLNQITITLKASTSLANGLEYFAELSDYEPPNFSLVVMTLDMEVLGFELGFVRGISHLVTGRQLTGQKIVCKEVLLMYKLLELLDQMKVMFQKDKIKAEKGSLIADIVQFANAVTYLNSQGNILYTMLDINSKGHAYQVLKVGCKLETFKMGELRLIKMLASFNSASVHDHMAENHISFTDSVLRLRAKKEARIAGSNQGSSKVLRRMNYVADVTEDLEKNYQLDFSQKEDAIAIFMELSCLLSNLNEDQLRSYEKWVKLFITDLQQIVKEIDTIFSSDENLLQVPGLNESDHKQVRKLEINLKSMLSKMPADNNLINSEYEEEQISSLSDPSSSEQESFSFNKNSEKQVY